MAFLFKQVKNTDVSMEFLYWDNEDDSGNRDSTSGAHPFEDGGAANHRLYYCYYQPTLFKE